MKISIHQPNFFPWFPFFQKIENSDIFVILTNCQFEKNNFQNRFNMNNSWYTMSVNKGIDLIKNKKYLFYQRDWTKIKKSLHKYSDILDLYDECINDNLSNTNILIILKTINLLKIKTKVVFDYPTELMSTNRLVDLCINYGGTEYLSGIGGKKYLDETIFKNNGIKVYYQNEVQPLTLIEKLYNSL